MIGMRMIVTDHPNSAASSIVIGALGLLGSDQVARLSRLLSFVLGGVDFGKNWETGKSLAVTDAVELAVRPRGKNAGVQ